MKYVNHYTGVGCEFTIAIGLPWNLWMIPYNNTTLVEFVTLFILSLLWLLLLLLLLRLSFFLASYPILMFGLNTVLCSSFGLCFHDCDFPVCLKYWLGVPMFEKGSLYVVLLLISWQRK